MTDPILAVTVPARLRELLNATTSISWEWIEDPGCPGIGDLLSASRSRAKVAEFLYEPDAALIVAAVSSLPALLDVVEAAKGALKFSRQVDLQAAVIQGGFPALDEALARLTGGSDD